MSYVMWYAIPAPKPPVSAETNAKCQIPNPKQIKAKQPR